MNDERAVRACMDVVAVERLAPGMVRVVTWSDAYVVDARGDGCACPDKSYNLAPAERCKHEWAALLATSERPCPANVTDSLTTRGGEPRPVMTDGGQTWTVYDHANDNQREFDSRSEAEQAVQTVTDLGGNPELFGPGERPAPGRIKDDEPLLCAECQDPIYRDDNLHKEDGETFHVNCNKRASEPTETDGGIAEVVEVDTVEPEPDITPEEFDDELPERTVADDPLTWMPGHFVDDIDGTPAINRKGFEVLAHHYDISTESTLEVAPEDTEHEYCRVKATARTANGRTAEAYGSAHVDRGDDAVLLLEMADTRARKRALSIATGVGVVAVEELRNEVDA